jgi:adenylylsulfate kinase-like enzyme
MDAKVIWITGLPGSGKTTLSINLAEFLSKNSIKAIRLDGDELRRVLSADKNFSRVERMKLSKIYQNLAYLLNSQGFWVIVSTVSLFHEIQNENRIVFQNYLEIYLKIESTVLREGERSHLYKSSELFLNDLAPEFPLKADIVLTTDKNMNRDSWLDSISDVILNKI